MDKTRSDGRAMAGSTRPGQERRWARHGETCDIPFADLSIRRRDIRLPCTLVNLSAYGGRGALTDRPQERRVAGALRSSDRGSARSLKARL